jgi:chromosome segregation ATPase
MRRHILGYMALLPLLAGCATSSDPRQGGLFGGLSGLSSGTYDQRVKEREAQLHASQQSQAELSSENARLEQEKAARQALVAQERQKLTKLDQEVQGLDRKVKQLSSRAGGADKQVKEAQQRLAELKKQLTSQGRAIDALEGGGDGSQPDDLRRRQLEEQRQALQREYDALMEFTLKLAP